VKPGVNATGGRTAAASAGSAGSAGSSSPGGSAAPPAPAKPAPPAVHVANGHLVDGDGHPLRLLGVNVSGGEDLCRYDFDTPAVFHGPTQAHDVVPNLAAAQDIASWRTNVVRVTLNEDCWLGNAQSKDGGQDGGINPAKAGAPYQAAVATYVRTLHAAGLAVILDIHENAPNVTIKGKPRPPADSFQRMADEDYTPSFWRSVATRFRDDPDVIFDLFNEPHSLDATPSGSPELTWSCWEHGCSFPDYETGNGTVKTDRPWRTAGMDELVAAVRSTGSTQPIMLGGLDWASDLSGWLPATQYLRTHGETQLVASFHTYNFAGCNTQSCWDQTLRPILAAGIPIITGELGEGTPPGQKNQVPCGDDNYITPYMNWADAAGVSYLGWSWNVAADGYTCSADPALIQTYGPPATPTQSFGQVFHDHLAKIAGH
jgi:hypothetical protein